MTENAEDIIGFSLFGLLIVSLVVDMFCALTWNKAYFTSGLMIFVKRIPIDHWHTNIPDLSLFENRFHSNVTSSLTFKEIERHSYGFREKAFRFKWVRYSPLMHGLLTFDADNGQVIVKGFANWYALAFSLMWLGLLVSFFIGARLDGNATFFLPILLGAIAFFTLVMGILYWIQASRFLNIASFAAQLWARKYIRDDHEGA